MVLVAGMVKLQHTSGRVLAIADVANARWLYFCSTLPPLQSRVQDAPCKTYLKGDVVCRCVGDIPPAWIILCALISPFEALCHQHVSVRLQPCHGNNIHFDRIVKQLNKLGACRKPTSRCSLLETAGLAAAVAARARAATSVSLLATTPASAGNSCCSNTNDNRQLERHMPRPNHLQPRLALRLTHTCV